MRRIVYKNAGGVAIVTPVASPDQTDAQAERVAWDRLQACIANPEWRSQYGEATDPVWVDESRIPAYNPATRGTWTYEQIVGATK